MKLKTSLPAILLGAFLFCLTTTAFSQTRKPSVFEYLTATEGTALTLSTDVSKLIEEKNTGNYVPGKLTNAEGKSYELKVKPRGKYRRKISAIPPLKLKFKKNLLESMGLDTLNEIKLVLPCTLDEQGNELVVREYLAYRLFEQLTPNSTRARLINLTLVNTGLGNAAQYQVSAILLEDDEEIAVRLNGQSVETFGYTMDSLEQNQAALVAMFQFMIGNTDWSVQEQRNVRFIRNRAGELLLIPFDFDFSGLVNAPYAVPTGGLGLKSVRERFLMKDNLPDAPIRKAAQTIRDARSELYRLCQSAAVGRSSGMKVANYLDSFYQYLEAGESASFR